VKFDNTTTAMSSFD